MDEPLIAAKQPAVLSLDPGTYYFIGAGAGGRKTSRFATGRTAAQALRRWNSP